MTGDRDIAREACRRAGLSPAAVSEPVHQHATSVFVHEPAGVVVRVSGPGHSSAAARRAVAVAGWLNGQGFPAAAPAAGMAPDEIDGRAVTFWRYYPQDRRSQPPASVLGRLLRELHSLPVPPPVTLPVYSPLAGLGEALDADDILPPAGRAWLAERRAELLADYRRLHSALGSGLIHGDAYPGNLLRDGARAVLGDWDEVATGPRELDLVNVFLQGQRFGRTPQELRGFTAAYGYDVTAWPGFAVLLDIRSLHTLGSFIRRARVSESAAAELAYRLHTLKAGDAAARWHAAS